MGAKGTVDFALALGFFVFRQSANLRRPHLEQVPIVRSQLGILSKRDTCFGIQQQIGGEVLLRVEPRANRDLGVMHTKRVEIEQVGQRRVRGDKENISIDMNVFEVVEQGSDHRLQQVYIERGPPAR